MLRWAEMFDECPKRTGGKEQDGVHKSCSLSMIIGRNLFEKQKMPTRYSENKHSIVLINYAFLTTVQAKKNDFYRMNHA